MSAVRFEPTISAGERPQAYAFDSAATGTSKVFNSESANDQNTEHLVLTVTLKLNYVPRFSCDVEKVFSKQMYILVKIRREFLFQNLMNPIVCLESVVGIADFYALDGPVAKTCGGEIFPTRSERPRGLPNLLHNGYRFFQAVNQPECGVNHPSPSKAEVKK